MESQGLSFHYLNGYHTRKPAQADAWYAAPDDYDGDVLYTQN